MTRNPFPTLPALALALLGLLGLAGCGDTTPRAEPPTTQAFTPPSSGPAASDVVTVTATDFSFEDVPQAVPAGTKLSLRNGSPVELHEVVAFRVPDGETRSTRELMALPPPELGRALGAPRTVLVQPPKSSEVIYAIGDGILAEPGRYLLICNVPTGANPSDYLAAAGASRGGPPQIAGGPPHHTHGMFTELTVK